VQLQPPDHTVPTTTTHRVALRARQKGPSPQYRPAVSDGLQGRMTCTCAHMHVCVRVCVRVCVHACMLACPRACVRACLRACMRACMSVCVPACVHECLRACVRACERACVRVCVRVCVCACVCSCVRACVRACVSVWVRARAQPQGFAMRVCSRVSHQEPCILPALFSQHLRSQLLRWQHLVHGRWCCSHAGEALVTCCSCSSSPVCAHGARCVRWGAAGQWAVDRSLR